MLVLQAREVASSGVFDDFLKARGDISAVEIRASNSFNTASENTDPSDAIVAHYRATQLRQEQRGPAAP